MNDPHTHRQPSSETHLRAWVSRSVNIFKSMLPYVFYLKLLFICIKTRVVLCGPVSPQASSFLEAVSSVKPKSIYIEIYTPLKLHVVDSY